MSSRRELLKGMALTPLATVLADPRLARAAAQGTRTVTITTGGASVTGALAEPEAEVKAGIVLIHEWWGLNDQIRAVAAELAKHGYLSLAADLYDGNTTTEPDAARSLTQKVDGNLATETLVAWVEWLRKDARSRNRIGTIGWCFGGGWSLNVSTATAVEATVIYYGQVNKTAAEVSTLAGPVLGHFATKDKWINGDMVGGFEQALESAGKRYASHWYVAQHGFANPTTARYDEEDAELAWQRTLAFFQKHLG